MSGYNHAKLPHAATWPTSAQENGPGNPPGRHVLLCVSEPSRLILRFFHQMSGRRERVCILLAGGSHARCNDARQSEAHQDHVAVARSVEG